MLLGLLRAYLGWVDEGEGEEAMVVEQKRGIRDVPPHAAVLL